MAYDNRSPVDADVDSYMDSWYQRRLTEYQQRLDHDQEQVNIFRQSINADDGLPDEHAEVITKHLAASGRGAEMGSGQVSYQDLRDAYDAARAAGELDSAPRGSLS